MRAGYSLLRCTLVVGAALLGSCTFPDFQVLRGEGGRATTSTGSLQGGGGQGTASGGGTTSATAGGQGGEGAGECGDGGAAGDGSGGDALCDKDGDKHYAAGQPCCGDDCDDDDSNVFWDQPAYFPVESKHNGWDYNCMGGEQKNTDQLFKLTGTPECTVVEDCVKPAAGYSNTAACGSTESYFQCEGLFMVNCKVIEADAPEPLKCH